MTDYEAMGRALELALRGTGKVSPNPRVGCVIVRDGRIIAEGWHDHFGGLHAEVHAIESATESLDGATLVVTLEPCIHWGKQPPCTDAILATKRRSDGTIDPTRGISRVVIGMPDPNPLASGGIERLRSIGIEVVVGVREHECRWLNRFFIKHVTTGSPYVVAKVATSLDGCLATATGQSQWITGEESRRRVHALRAEIDAVLVGRGTVEKDNPHLGPRLVRGRMPRRIVLDTALRLDPTVRLLCDEHRTSTIVCTGEQASRSAKAEMLRRNGVSIVAVPLDAKGRLSLPDALRLLAQEYTITSILVEGGQQVLSSFAEQRLIDELHLFVAPIIVGNGMHAFSAFSVSSLEDAPCWRIHAMGRSGEDMHIVLLPQQGAGSA